MEANRIMSVLAVVLLAACTIVAVTLGIVQHDRDYVPEEAIRDLVEIMARDGIFIDPAIISPKRGEGTVYVFDSEGYNGTVAELLSGSRIRDTYVIPNGGELLVLENGDCCEFGENFTFRYRAANADDFSPNILDLRYYANPKTEAEAKESVAAVKTFLANGSREFSSDGKLKVAVIIDGIWEVSGIEYVLCSRTIDGVAITGNLVLCTVENKKVTAAYGTWCFFTPGTSHSAQLSDLINILFNVKKNLSSDAAYDSAPISDPISDAELMPELSDGAAGAAASTTTTIESIKFCYSLYFFGAEESFCLIPCWQITTDNQRELIYNAIDGTLYTIIQK